MSGKLVRLLYLGSLLWLITSAQSVFLGLGPVFSLEAAPVEPRDCCRCCEAETGDACLQVPASKDNKSCQEQTNSPSILAQHYPYRTLPRSRVELFRGRLKETDSQIVIYSPCCLFSTYLQLKQPVWQDSSFPPSGLQEQLYFPFYFFALWLI